MTPDSLRVVLGGVFAHNGRTYVAVVAAEPGSCRDKSNAKCCFNDFDGHRKCNCPKGFPSCAGIIFQENNYNPMQSMLCSRCGAITICHRDSDERVHKCRICCMALRIQEAKP